MSLNGGVFLPNALYAPFFTLSGLMRKAPEKKQFFHVWNREFNSEVQHPPNQATCRSSSNTIWGCLKSKHLRGLRLSRRSKADYSSGLSWLRSLPLGTYCRNKPLLFSFRPRSHALYGCAK